MKHFLAYQKFYCTIFCKLSFKYFFKKIFVLLIAVNKENSKIFTNIKKVNQFSRKNSHFQGVSSALEMKFQIQALFKEVKDLHKQCTMSETQSLIYWYKIIDMQEFLKLTAYVLPLNPVQLTTGLENYKLIFVE